MKLPLFNNIESKYTIMMNNETALISLCRI